MDSKDFKASSSSSASTSTSKTAAFHVQQTEAWDLDDASDDTVSLLPRYSVDDDLEGLD